MESRAFLQRGRAGSLRRPEKPGQARRARLHPRPALRALLCRNAGAARGRGATHTAPRRRPHSPSTIPAAALTTSKDIASNTQPPGLPAECAPAASSTRRLHHRTSRRSSRRKSPHRQGSIGYGWLRRRARGAAAAIFGSGRGNFRFRRRLRATPSLPAALETRGAEVPPGVSLARDTPAAL